MNNKSPKLPQQRDFNKGRNEAYDLAITSLKSLQDIELQCQRSGASLEDTAYGQLIVLKYFGEDHVITLPQGKVILKDSGKEVALTDSLLILHYFLNAKNTSSKETFLSFRDLPEGRVYYPTFCKRTIAPLLQHFGNDFKLLESFFRKLDGHMSDKGDLSFVFSPFNGISITLVFWKGDDDFPPAANYLFRDNITDYLPIEDIANLCQVITAKLLSTSS